jgi:hypothetical protein
VTLTSALRATATTRPIAVGRIQLGLEFHDGGGTKLALLGATETDHFTFNRFWKITSRI